MVVGRIVPLLLCPCRVVVSMVHGGVVVVWSSHGGGVDGCMVVVSSLHDHVVVGCCMVVCFVVMLHQWYGHVSGQLWTGWLLSCCLIVPCGRGHMVVVHHHGLHSDVAPVCPLGVPIR